MGITVTHQHYEGTDELCVEFYRCEPCGFERIPKQQDTDFAKENSVRGKTTANYCPGCGAYITWKVDGD